MLNNPKISVIVPVYNAEKYIRQCIDSIINQTIDNIEIVLIDDGSTDSSPLIIDEYKKRFPQIVVVHQNNKGIAQARTKGYSLASGDYIAWVDDDDFVEPNMFERLYDTACYNKADYVICNYKFFPEKVATKEKWFKIYKGIVDWHFIERNTHPWNKLVSRALCERFGMEEKLPIFGDSVYVGLMLYAKNIITLNEELYNYRVGHNSESGGFIGKVPKYKDGCDIVRRQKEFLIGTEYSESLREYFDYRYLYSGIQLMIVASINKDKASYKKGQKIYKENKKNNLCKTILDNNHGKLRSFVFRNIIPSSYYLSCLACSTIKQ